MVDGQALVLVGHLEGAAESIGELGDACLGIAQLLQLANDHVLGTVLAEDFHRLASVSPTIEVLDVADTLVDVGTAKITTLLLLMPVPAEDGWQAGVNRKTALPGVEVGP